MSSKNWHFYDSTTGIFSARTFSTPESVKKLDVVPHGHVAIEGTFDHLSQRVDVASGEVIEYKPEQPSPDHEWQEPTKRWRLSEAASAKAATLAASVARIAALRDSQHDLVRRAILGDADARAALQGIEDEIAGLRRVAVADASDQSGV